MAQSAHRLARCLPSLWAQSLVDTGSQPFAVAVNPATNKIYVVNNGPNTVTVIDGATNTTRTVTVGPPR